jgi:hypothetical protein
MMISLNIQRSDRGYVCSTDDQYSDLGLWLQYDLGPSGGGGVPEELFEDIGAFRAGRKEQVEVWGNLLRVRIGKEGVVIQTMLTSGAGEPCELSLDELVDAVLRWFDVVNPELAANLRKIQSTW